MNKLYVRTVTAFVRTTKHSYQHSMWGCKDDIFYGEYESYTKIIDNVEDLSDKLFEKCYKWFKPAICFPYTDGQNWDYIKVKNTDFDKFIIHIEYRELRPSAVTIVSLANTLPAHEFIQYLKDNNISYTGLDK